MKTPDIFDLYTDYLITSFSYTTATGLSGLMIIMPTNEVVLLAMWLFLEGVIKN
jgi:hypothetical protein